MTTNPGNRVFEQVHAVLQGTLNRCGFHDADCPFCGKPAKPGQNHFGYSYDERTGVGGYHCFVCGARGTLNDLANRLDVETGGYAPLTHRQAVEPKPIARWRLYPDKLLDSYRDHPQRFEMWQRYKALTAETIARFDFGVGRLPFQRQDGSWYLSRQEWLVVPLWEDGELVGLRGRNRNTTGPKWISATGSSYTLWGVDFVRPGAVTWLCENYVDAAWLMQEHPEWCAVAIGGATTWKPKWGRRLAERRPELVIVALDRDLPGQATGAFRRELERAWVAARGTQPPPANGPKIANSLRRAGVNAVLFRWPEDAPAKAGLDWALAHPEKQAA